MAAASSTFPDLDLTLAVSRVEVVSNVEIETIKTALRWLFDEAQSQRKAAAVAKAANPQNQMDELGKVVQDQSASVQALQEQQEKLLQSSQLSEQALGPLKEVPDTLRRLQEGQDSAAGMQSHLLSLQQQLKTLTEGHTKLGQAVAALKAAAAPTGSTESKAGSQAGQQVADRAAAFSTGAASASSPAPSTGAIAASSPVPSIGADAASSPAPSTGAAAANSLPELQGQSNLSVQPGVASGIQNGDFAQRLDALADEVAQLKAASSSMRQPSGSGQPHSSTSGQATETRAAVPSSTGSNALSDGIDSSVAGKQHRNGEGSDAEERLAALSTALSEMQEQVGGQRQVVGQLQAAEGELRRLLADKAGLADMQAVLQAQSAPALVPVPKGESAEAGLAGAINGLGAKVGGLEALLALAQQRIADKADSADLDNLRNTLNKLRAAIGDDTVLGMLPGTGQASPSAGPDAADVVPAETHDPPPPNGLSGIGAKGHRTKSSAAIPSNSLNVRLATLERSMSAANKMTSGARRTTSNAAVPLTSSSYGGTGGPPSSSSNGADLADRVAVLEAQLSQFKQSESPGVTSVKSLGLRSNPSLANSAQLAQSDSALREQLSQLQQQFEALMSGKANKADVEALQLHAAMVSGGSSLTSTGGSRGKSISTSSSGGGSGSNGIDSSGGVNIADAGKGAAGTGNGASDAGGMAGLLEAVQRMVGGKADREEVHGLRRLLADKVNVADHQAAYENLERSMLELQPGATSARSTAGLLGAAPAPGPKGSHRGAAGLVPVRPARRTLQDENAAPSSELASVREDVQQLKAAVEVLTNATHLMAIPTTSSSVAEPGRRTTVEPRVAELVHGGVSTAMAAVASGATAGGANLPALPAAATAAAAAIAGLRAPVDASATKGNALHSLNGLSKQKQGKDGLTSTEATAAKGPAAPTPTPRADERADGSSPQVLPQQGSGVGLEGEAGGPLHELMSSMRAGQLGHKMNDSDIHDQLAQRLTALERLVKKLTQQPQAPGHVAGAPTGKGPDDRLLRRLGSDLALVKKRLDEIAPPKDPGALLMMREGDHAMLAGKPLQGYRCMACDRPLAKLDPDMGGFIPRPHMPISVSMEPSKNIGVVPSMKEGPGGRAGAARKGPPPAQHSRSAVHLQHPHSGEDAVGPQNWYKEAGGQPAQALPKEDVGPHLPPGGWRAGTSQSSRAQTSKGSSRTPGTRTVAENDELVAWDPQGAVPLPDIHAKSKT